MLILHAQPVSSHHDFARTSDLFALKSCTRLRAHDIPFPYYSQLLQDSGKSSTCIQLGAKHFGHAYALEV